MLLVLTSTLMGWLFSSSRAYLALNRKKSISSAAASISAWMTVLPCRERSHQIKALRGGRGGGECSSREPQRCGTARPDAVCGLPLSRRPHARFRETRPPANPHPATSPLHRAEANAARACARGHHIPPVFPHCPLVPPLGKPGLLGCFARVNPAHRSPPHQLILFP